MENGGPPNLQADSDDAPVLNNPSIPESLQQDVDRIKGDMIGDTVYSERWVLKTMMTITEKFPVYCGEEPEELESSLEEDVCTIWDMSAEPDVARFLTQHNILDLIAAVIGQCQNARLMEMMIGVLGNLACQSEIRAKVSERKELVAILVSHLRYPDTLALVQLVRLIRTCLWELRSCEPKSDNSWLAALTQPDACESLAFIIGSSVEEDLLTACIQLMETLIYIKLPNDEGFLGKYFSSSGMVSSMVEGIRELTSETTENYDDAEESEDNNEICIKSNKVEEACHQWVSALNGISLCQEGQLTLREHGGHITNLLEGIMRQFLDQENWKECLDDHIDFIMCAANLLTLLLPTNFNPGCLVCVVMLLDKVQGQSGIQENLEDCVVSVAAAEGVQSQVLITLDQCHAPEVELCFKAIAKHDRALLAQLLAELQCTNKHQRLCDIADQILMVSQAQARMSSSEPQR